jgi:hypothetical protein
MRPTLRGASVFSARSIATLTMYAAADSSTPCVTCVNPARRKGLSGVELLPLRSAAAGRWSYGKELCEASPSAGFGRSECGDWEELL